MPTTQMPIDGVFDVTSGRLTGIAGPAGPEVSLVTQDVTTGALYSGTAQIGIAEVTPYVNMTATGTAFAGACELAGYDCTVAAGNITIYDNTSASGVVIVPTTALAVGRVEFNFKRALTNGCHVVLSGAATVNVLVG